MPAITPNQTNHLRHDVAFRGTTAEPFGTPASILKGNRNEKRRLIIEARALVRAPDLTVAARGLVSVKRRWARVGPAAPEYEGKLQRRFDRAYDAFSDRVNAAQVSERTTQTKENR